MELREHEADLLGSYVNGNISDFKAGLNELSKAELIDFIYNVQEQSHMEANEILSICRKYIN